VKAVGNENKSYGCVYMYMAVMVMLIITIE